MFRYSGLLGAALLAISATASSAATVTPNGSRVLVNTGNGFFSVQGTTQVPPGALIMTEEGSAALVMYSPSCSVRIGGPRVWTVFSEPPCASGSSLVDLAPMAPTPVAAAPAGAAADVGPLIPEAGAAAGGLGSSTLVIGGLVVAGGAALALASGGGGSSKPKPVSP